MKKAVALILTLFMALSLAACGSGTNSGGAGSAQAVQGSAAGSAGGTHIYVLTASEDHGWTGSVATFAKQKVEEVNKKGTYTAELITASSAANQISEIEDIVNSGKKNIAVVIQPIDDTVKSAIQQMVDAKIPYVAFDRIINAVSSTAVSNVKGDNEGSGAGSAAYFVGLGMKPGDKVYVYEGDTSSVTTLRDNGFKQYLTGKLEFGGKKIDSSAQWTDDNLKSITYSGAMNWSRSNTKTAFESLMGDSRNASIKWWYAEDDELTMGMLEALKGGGIADSAKQAFLANKPAITGCGGLDELYNVLRGKTYTDISKQLGGLVSVTYSPSMIQTAIQDMVDHLDGKTVTQDHVIQCQNVTTENVSQFKSFT